MRHALWKRFISNFTEVHLESVSSELNPDLYICLVQGRYQLCVKNAIYSFADKYDNFWDTFKMMDLKSLEGKDILILGFGLGSIPYMLEKMDVKAHYTGVEYDEAVTFLFNKYQASEISSPIEIYQADAYLFMLQNERKYDLIAMDVFVEDKIPDEFLTDDFMLSLKNSLEEGGLLIWNFLYHHEQDRRFADDFYHNNFLRIFEKGDSVQTSGNKMLLSKKIVPSQT